MLVLTRKVGEQILIGDDVCLTVLEVRGNQMRLGITAPKDVPILRAEVMARPKPAKPQPPAAPQRHIEPQPDVIVHDNTCGMPA